MTRHAYIHNAWSLFVRSDIKKTNSETVTLSWNDLCCDRWRWRERPLEEKCLECAGGILNTSSEYIVWWLSDLQKNNLPNYTGLIRSRGNLFFLLKTQDLFSGTSPVTESLTSRPCSPSWWAASADETLSATSTSASATPRTDHSTATTTSATSLSRPINIH